METTIYVLSIVLSSVISALVLYAIIEKIHVNKLKKLVGPLRSNTTESQTYEIFNQVLNNELLFEEVKVAGRKFTGNEKYDVLNIDTSKFAYLVAIVATVSIKATSAERYFRRFKSELRMLLVGTNE
jgi:hypothetical protein